MTKLYFPPRFRENNLFSRSTFTIFHVNLCRYPAEPIEFEFQIQVIDQSVVLMKPNNLEMKKNVECTAERRVSSWSLAFCAH